MINIIGLTKEQTLIKFNEISQIDEKDLNWVWVDFDSPSEEELEILNSYFKFHTLAIEDCIHSLNKAKMDYYEEYTFFILNTLDKKHLDPKEISLFVSKKYIVSFHLEHLDEIEEAKKSVYENKWNFNKGTMYIFHQILDQVVDEFFPVLYNLEEKIDSLEENKDNRSIHNLVEEVFKLRSDIMRIRKVINPMRDLLYRILNSDRLENFKDHKIFFSDIYDHLVKLSDMLEWSREMTSDLRDSYISINSNRMNSNMMVLTVITTIFIPLSFIAGLYGMNFKYMPELEWQGGYFVVLTLMALIALFMFWWFKKKGWFDS